MDRIQNIKQGDLKDSIESRPLRRHVKTNVVLIRK